MARPSGWRGSAGRSRPGRGDEGALDVTGRAAVATAALYEPQIEGLRRGLREHGYIEGRNVTIEFRWAEGQYNRLPALAAAIVRLNVDVIITHGTLGTVACKQATSTIPIVMAIVANP